MPKHRPALKTRVQPYRKTKRLPPHDFWSQSDIVLYMLRFLALIDILRFSHVDRACSMYAKEYLKCRTYRYTSPFFTECPGFVPPSHEQGHSSLFEGFFRVLERTHSWIVGSVALAVASTLSDVPSPDNLNVISYYENFDAWETFMTKESGFVLEDRSWSAGPYISSGGWRLIFRHTAMPGSVVTITFSLRRNLGPLFFASPNTDQMIAIGASEIITPVLKNVSEQRHIQGWRKRMDALCFDPLYHRFFRTTSRFPGAITLHISTTGWDRPCGMSCPGRWRSVHELKGFAHIKWGGMGNVGQDIDPSLSLMGKSSLLFRFGARCRNPNCSNSPLDTE
ncbi:hypothetical protein R3P38DRAFT_3221633 [Favolaschia claudopus]|uniref:Uncharacterized protein n=1 Tax=Favolaschia claudopus TaxID=2862362 RepID=A0AAW0A037_9AGAR